MAAAVSAAVDVARSTNNTKDDGCGSGNSNNNDDKAKAPTATTATAASPSPPLLLRSLTLRDDDLGCSDELKVFTEEVEEEEEDGELLDGDVARRRRRRDNSSSPQKSSLLLSSSSSCEELQAALTEEKSLLIRETELMSLAGSCQGRLLKREEQQQVHLAELEELERSGRIANARKSSLITGVLCLNYPWHNTI